MTNVIPLRRDGDDITFDELINDIHEIVDPESVTVVISRDKEGYLCVLTNSGNKGYVLSRMMHGVEVMNNFLKEDMD